MHTQLGALETRKLDPRAPLDAQECAQNRHHKTSPFIRVITSLVKFQLELPRRAGRGVGLVRPNAAYFGAASVDSERTPTTPPVILVPPLLCLSIATSCLVNASPISTLARSMCSRADQCRRHDAQLWPPRGDHCRIRPKKTCTIMFFRIFFATAHSTR